MDKSEKQNEGEDLVKQYQTNVHLLSREEIQINFETDFTQGLSLPKYKEKLEKFGPNKLTPSKETPLFIKFLKIMFCNVFNILLLVAALLCGIAIIIDRNNKDYIYLCVVLIIAVLLTTVVTVYQEYSSGQKMKSFTNLLPSNVNVIREGEVRDILAEEIVPGDLIKLRQGDKVPADLLVLDCSHDCKVDNSSITGESDPILRKPEMTNEDPLETSNLLFLGTLVVQGTALCLAYKTGDKTLMGRIAKLTARTKTTKTPIGKEISHFIKIVSIIAVSLGVIFGILNYILRKELMKTLILTIGIIVANVPEGLPMTITMSLALASQRMTRKSVLVKNLECVETLGSTSVICSDKTGTLTINKMTVSHIFYDNKERSVDTHNPKKGDFEPTDMTFMRLIRCASLCNKAVYNKDGEILGDASESALIKFANPNLPKALNEYREEHEEVFGIPFNSKNKWQLSVQRLNNKKSSFVVVMKGAPERIINFCDRIYDNGEVRPMTDEDRDEINKGILSFAKQGERVLGFCDVELDADEFPSDYKFEGDLPGETNFPFRLNEDDPGYVFIGLTALIDPPRPSVPDSVLSCQSAGIRVFMVTGDHPTTARAIASKVNIILKTDDVLDLNEMEFSKSNPQLEILETLEKTKSQSLVITGRHISMMIENTSEDMVIRFWNSVLKYNRIVFSRTSPQQKLLIVESCQKRNSIVAVTGDGVNDSPALKKADIGVAMGIAGTDVAKEAADMILMDDNFSSIVKGIEEGRVIFDNIKKSIAYTLSSNIPEVAPVLVSLIFGNPITLKTIQIFVIDLGTDMVPAISMSHEKKEADIMRIKPRHPQKDRLVSEIMIGFSYAMIGVIQSLAAFYTFFALFNDNGLSPWQLNNLDAYGKFESCEAENAFLTCTSEKLFEDGKSYCSYTAIAITDKTIVEAATYPNKSCEDRQYLLGMGNAIYVIAIVEVQIADVIISKTRRNSLTDQGMGNKLMNFGIVLELVMMVVLVYTPLRVVFSFSSVPVKYWILPLPFFMIIVIFDESRKYFIRRNFDGWVKRNTYW